MKLKKLLTALFLVLLSHGCIGVYPVDPDPPVYYAPGDEEAWLADIEGNESPTKP